MTEAYKPLVFSIVEFLQDITAGSLKIEGLDSESVEVAIQCLSSTFDIDLNGEADKARYSIKPLTLPGVYALGLAGKEQLSSALAQQLSGLTTSTAAPAPATEAAPTATPTSELDNDPEFPAFLSALERKQYFSGTEPGSTEYQDRLEKAKVGYLNRKQAHQQQSKKIEQDPLEQAEKYKSEGNTLLATNPQKAVELYTKAIELNPKNAIYFCNRAAALCKLGKYEEAIKDGTLSQQIDPKYNKAFGRLGFAYLALGKVDEAEENYLKALELDPNNPTYQDALEEIGNRRIKGTSNAGAAAGGTPAGGAPGGFDFASLMNNPMLRQMGQQFAASQAQAQPAGASPAGTSPGGFPAAVPRGVSPGGSFPGGGFPGAGFPGAGAAPAGPGGNPLAGLGDLDFGSLMNNPNLMNMANSLMQNPEFSQMAQNLMSNPDAVNQMMSAFGAGKK